MTIWMRIQNGKAEEHYIMLCEACENAPSWDTENSREKALGILLPYLTRCLPMNEDSDDERV